jgi:succinate dehydrogenase / fumarate reductase membrane anchor subunit
MSLQSPLGKFLGHGSAKEGVQHWWSQRLTAVALVPLTLWFVVALLGMENFAHAEILGWMAQPFNAIMLILLAISILSHSQLGVQVVVEDYVHGWAKIVALMGSKLVHIAVGVAVIYSVIIISVGSS